MSKTTFTSRRTLRRQAQRQIFKEHRKAMVAAFNKEFEQAERTPFDHKASRRSAHHGSLP